MSLESFHDRKLIALFSATFQECELIIEKLSKKSEFLIQSMPFIKAEIESLEILLCITGVGKTNAAVSALLTFQNFPVSKAVLSGIAGAYPLSGLNVGDIAVAEREIFADEGLLINCEDSETSFVFINNEDFQLYIPEFLKNLRRGTFLTVSACTGNLNRAKFLEKKFNAICENMEGAAIAKVAKIYEIPLLEIRSISNIVTDRTELLKIEDVKKFAKIVQEFIVESLALIVENP